MKTPSAEVPQRKAKLQTFATNNVIKKKIKQLDREKKLLQEIFAEQLHGIANLVVTNIRLASNTLSSHEPFVAQTEPLIRGKRATQLSGLKNDTVA